MIKPTAIFSGLLRAYRAVTEIAIGTLRHMSRAQLAVVAGSLAYTTILSLIPLLAVSFSVFKAFGGAEKLYSALEPVIVSNLAAGAGQDAVRTLRRLIENANAGALGAAGVIGLIFTSLAMLASIEKAIHQIWNEPNNRSLLTRIAFYWLVITLGPLGLAIALGAAGSSGLHLSVLLPSAATGFLMTAAILCVLYKFVPNRKVRWRPAMISAFFAAIVWNLARVGYSFYNRSTSGTSKIYGGLAAIPILLLWIYIVWIVVLAGAALTATLQKRIESK